MCGGGGGGCVNAVQFQSSVSLMAEIAFLFLLLKNYIAWNDVNFFERVFILLPNLAKKFISKRLYVYRYLVVDFKFRKIKFVRSNLRVMVWFY